MILRKKINFSAEPRAEYGVNYKDKYISALEENIQLRKELSAFTKTATAAGA